jgi:hypothetical protein
MESSEETDGRYYQAHVKTTRRDRGQSLGHRRAFDMIRSAISTMMPTKNSFTNITIHSLKKETDAGTKPMLKLPDATVVRALDIAGRGI